MKQDVQNTYETVIGLEVHVQLNTKTKIFCGCPNDFGKPPNTLVCPVCLGLPGTLPVLNKEALNSAIKIACALNCKVSPFIKFDRKNYYYPDLPKGYQISQFDKPIARDGYLEFFEGKADIKRVRIHRAHLEEDAGKLIHDGGTNSSLVDYNRTGTPLMEIVTEPDIRSSQEAYDYLQALKLTIQYIGVSDCDMEKGSLRCDANISIREFGDEKLGTKSEIKNLNSFKAVKAALDFEVTRHTQMKESGEALVQETRLWNDEKGMTLPMRSKEEAHDYRYFPEPDLVPFMVEEEAIAGIKDSLPELPLARQKRLMETYKLSEYDCRIIVQDLGLAEFFEECAGHYDNPKKICNWISGPLLQEINARKQTVVQLKITPEQLAALIRKVEEGSVSNLAGKDALKHMLETGQSAEETIEAKGLAQVSDEGELDDLITGIMDEHTNIVEQIKEGKESAVGFLIGQAMKKSQGKANPKKIGEMIKRRLAS